MEFMIAVEGFRQPFLLCLKSAAEKTRRVVPIVLLSLAVFFFQGCSDGANFHAVLHALCISLPHCLLLEDGVPCSELEDVRVDDHTNHEIAKKEVCKKNVRGKEDVGEAAIIGRVGKDHVTVVGREKELAECVQCRLRVVKSNDLGREQRFPQRTKLRPLEQGRLDVHRRETLHPNNGGDVHEGDEHASNGCDGGHNAEKCVNDETG
mmetsp:Transcript_14877/g.32335  ORF Transcript_14877/g.32335 Transcript_14877/m.32335 type:complete len:207 (-) Transcript_14877:289-909(-)